ncbi:MAG: methyltransferase domain-containing protein [Gallionella sp.]|nr:methyltransferase domain-containing protein [Gallionella sp.]
MKKHFTQLKNHVRSFKDANNPLFRALYWTLKKPFEIKKLLTDGSHRSVVMTKLTAGQHAHQLVNYTTPHRYPAVFRACAEYFAAAQPLTLLSFGCSTGEEVFSLRTYFPHAELVGVDINRRNIRVAQASRQKDARMIFCTELPAQGQYDAIFCMAVLQRTENRLPDTTDSGQIYPFHRFDTQVTLLDERLRLGGLFVIDNADYRFEDASVAAKYLPIEHPPRKQRDRPIFDRNNQRSLVPYDNPRVFKKIAV